MNLALVNHNHFVTLQNPGKSKDMHLGSPKLAKLAGMANMGRFSKSFDYGSRNHLATAPQFEASNNATPRVPEIQMINKLYGLVPKKFVISERVRPETAAAVNLRSRSRVRPTTASRVRYSKSGHRILVNPRQGSLDSSKSTSDSLSRSGEESITDASNQKSKDGSFSASCTPLITRRMSFEKSYLRSFKHMKLVPDCPLNNKMPETPIPEPVNHRVIHIDLNRMRWTDDDGINSADESPAVKTQEVESEPKEKSGAGEGMKSSNSKGGRLRKTISFDEDALRSDKKEEKPKMEKKCKRPATAKQITPKNSDESNGTTTEDKTPAETAPSLSILAPNTGTVVAEEPPPIPWTTGKTTAERRAKFQKSFSIHPSMESSFDSCLGFGVESESEATPYPSSMMRTGRRSLHVESPNDDVDTLLSTSKTKEKDRFSEHNNQYNSFSAPGLSKITSNNFSRSMSTLVNATNENLPASFPSIGNGKFPSANNLRQQETNDSSSRIDFNRKSTAERRSCFRKSMSLPEGNGANANANTSGKNNEKSTSKKSTPPLIRSASLQHTNSRNDSHTNARNKSIQNGTSSKPVIKKPVLDMSKTTRLRPRTAPTNHTKKSDGPGTGADTNKSKSGASNNNGQRRQPLKALQFPVSNGTQRQNSKESGGGAGGSSISTSTRKTQGHEHKLVRRATTTAMDVKKVSWERGVADNEKSEAKEETEPEAPPAPKKHSFKTLKNLPTYLRLLQQPRRRSISVDDDSLLKFTTASVAAAESTPSPSRSTGVAESTAVNTTFERKQELDITPAVPAMKNTKKREECLKIYEKMMKVGCNVRLQTIFRGMMSPVEYREFITAAEASVQHQAKLDEIQAEDGPNAEGGNYSAHETDKLKTPVQAIETN